MRRLPAFALAAGVWALPSGVFAQRQADLFVGTFPPPQVNADGSSGVGAFSAPALSLVLPGAGQHVLDQRRKWLYLALEVGAWALFVERRHAASDYRDRYRDFAWENSRLRGSVRVDGDWAYYETLAHWARSGAYDADIGSVGVQPESDVSTYNGSIWLLATKMFLPGSQSVPVTDPAYQDALSYYGKRAYGQEMLWDWSGVPGAQGEYTRLVDASDDRFRQATTVVGLVIANHIASAIDAYLSTRGVGRAAFDAAPGAVGIEWRASMKVYVPR